MSSIFYRVSNIETDQGLWYDKNGQFTGLIHNEFNFCQNNELLMDFDPDVVGYLSAVEQLDILYNWFSKSDILKLQDYNYFIHEYKCNDFKWYDKFHHYLINQNDIKLNKRIILF